MTSFGLYDPARDSGDAPKSVGAGLLLVMGSVAGLLVLGLTVFDLGMPLAAMSSLVAFIPAIFYLAIFLWLDRFDPEPPITLLIAFIWGATISIFFSALVNDLFGYLLGEQVAGLISAPFIEELSKGLGVLLVAILFRRDFDSVVDGIVYAGVVALGFAAMENVEYYGRSFADGGIEKLFSTFFVRGVMAPFSHVLFTSMTGIGIGIARESNKYLTKITAPMIGLCCAMFLHAFWNLLATLGGGTFLVGYFLVQIPLFLTFVALTFYLVMREGRILRQTLACEVERGLISHRQLEITISVFQRTKWVARALNNPSIFNARRKYLRSVAKLGLCHWHQQRADEVKRISASLPLIAQLQAEVFSLRDQI